jgi:DNA repair protein RadA/Sms
MVEEVEVVAPPTAPLHAGRGLGQRSAPQRLSEISGQVEDRLPLSIAEFARVLGGGVVPGTLSVCHQLLRYGYLAEEKKIGI